MKLKHIDSIRGIAILMVILVHTSQNFLGIGLLGTYVLKYGQMGVQLFFVASAYTLCLSATNRKIETNKLSKYAIRRYFRIAPVYYMGILFYFLLSIIQSWYMNSFTIPMKYTFANVWSNLTFTHGFFEPANNNIVPGGWSIGTEMAFYIIFPFLFFLAEMLNVNRAKVFFLWLFYSFVFSQVAIISIVLCTEYRMENNNFLYFNIVNQLPVFCIGIGYYFLDKYELIKSNWKLDLFYFLVLSFLSFVLGLLSIKLNVGYIFSIIPFISGLSFISLIEIFKKVKFLNHPLLMRIGHVSYSMYIFHIIFAYDLSEFLGGKISYFVGDYLSLLILYFITLAGTFSIAILSEKIIEKPFIEYGRKIINNMQ